MIKTEMKNGAALVATVEPEDKSCIIVWLQKSSTERTPICFAEYKADPEDIVVAVYKEQQEEPAFEESYYIGNNYLGDTLRVIKEKRGLLQLHHDEIEAVLKNIETGAAIADEDETENLTMGKEHLYKAISHLEEAISEIGDVATYLD